MTDDTRLADATRTIEDLDCKVQRLTARCEQAEKAEARANKAEQDVQALRTELDGARLVASGWEERVAAEAVKHQQERAATTAFHQAIDAAQATTQ